MRNSSQENAIVVDLFGGSGSTLMAAEQLNRAACLMEIDPIYASVIVRRYVSNAGSIADVRVIRQGQTLEGAAVYLPTEEDLAFKDGTVHDTQNGPRKAEQPE